MFLNGVNVVLCGNEHNFKGATIAWATKIEKGHAMVSLPSEAAVTNAILSKKVFSINVLGHNQSNIARQYGGSKQTRTFSKNIHDLDFDLWSIPVVRNCRAHFLCNVIQGIPVNEQTILIAKISEHGFTESVAPLVYDHATYFD
jgi:flavin reductase (DIM6/NTAB) family NADH-FMN oxidoreductase RutF